MATALVTGQSGEGFEAQVTELRPNSILLSLDRPLSFREQVTIELLGTLLEGEVVFAGEREAAIAFPMSPEIFELIEAVESEEEIRDGEAAEAHADAAEALPVDEAELAALLKDGIGGAAGMPATEERRPEVLVSTLDAPLHTVTDLAGVKLLESTIYAEVDAGGEVLPKDALDALAHLLTLLSDRPILARAAGPVKVAQLTFQNMSLELDAAALGGGVLALRARDLEEVEAMVSQLKRALDHFETRDLRPATASESDHESDPDPADVPDLGADGRTVLFRTLGQYKVQHRVNLKNGAIVLKSDPLPAGTRRELLLVIPGARGPLHLSAQVMFQGPGTIGMSVSLNDVLKAKLEAMTVNPAAVELDAPAAPTKPAAPAVELDARLAGRPSLEELLNFTSQRPRRVADANGSYLRILEFLLSIRTNAVLRVSAEEEVTLWVYSGRVVFATRKPEKQDDLLGRRLVTSRAVPRTALGPVLEEVSSDRPLGALLVDRGKLTQEALNKELRAQIVDRVMLPRTFTEGRIEVRPWRDPPVRTKLLPVSGAYLIAELLHQELKTWTQQELTKGLMKHLERTLEIDLEKVDSAYRLQKKEHRFYQRAAQSPAALSMIGTTGGAGQSEGLRLSVLACALGFGKLGEIAKKREIEEARIATQDLLKEQLEQVKEATPFEVLGIHWSATQSEIKGAYEAERKKVMMRKSQTSADESRDLVQALMRRLDEARYVLTDAKKRKAERDRAADAMERQHASEHLVQQAEIAIFREEYEEAKDLLDTADELHPSRRGKQMRKRLETF